MSTQVFDRGVIKLYRHDRGFGFIVPANGDTEIFFHISRCCNGFTPGPGDPVEFSMYRDAQGRPRADVVRLAIARAAE